MKKFVALLLAANFYVFVSAQSLSDLQAPKLLPPSPDAAALGKYGQIPVDKSTGIPNISIPIYEIKTPRFTLPISLAYHASGIRVDEIASWVGLGWSLNAGGLISRTVVGMPDENGYGFLSTTLRNPSNIQMATDSQYLQDAIKNLVDTKPDNFFFNFAEYSGSFVFGADKKPLLTPYKPLKITLTSSNNFEVVDDQGNLYKFSNKELATSDVSNLASAVSSWYISQMISADKSDTISFTYTTDAVWQNEFTFSFTQILGPMYDPSQSNLGAQHLDDLVQTVGLRSYDPLRIRTITFKGGKVDFATKSGRLDNATYALDSIVVSSFDNASALYTKLKIFKLSTGYFYSTIPNPTRLGTDEPSKYRLTLTGVTECDQNNVPIRSHQLDYNSSMLPPVHNFGQDNWGYYNGKFANKSLLEKQMFVGDNNVVQQVGGNEGADRTVSATDMQAGVLTRITYPTKGYTTFSYEPNQQSQAQTVPWTISANAIGYYQENSIFNYTPTSSNIINGGTIFHVVIRRTGDIPFSIPVVPYVQIVRVSDGVIIYSANASPTDNIDSYVSIPLVAGQQYQLIAVAQGGTSSSSSNDLPKAGISTTYQIPSNNNRLVGGLRVTTIRNFNFDSSLISVESYKYGANELGGGDLLGSSLLTNRTEHLCYFRLTESNTAGAQYPTYISLTGFRITFSNNSVYQLSSYSGSPVAYPVVTVYHGDSVNNIGKTVYQYAISSDSLLLCTQKYMLGLKPVPVTWKNGEPTREAVYKNFGNNQYGLLRETLNSYTNISKASGVGQIIGYDADLVGYTSEMLYAWEASDFYVFNYPITSGIRVLNRAIVNYYDSAGVTIAMADTTNFYYDNSKLYLATRVEKTDSKGLSIKRVTYRPLDKANILVLIPLAASASVAVDSLVARNILNPVIQEVEYRNSVRTQLSLTNYKLWTTNVLAPENVQLQISSNPIETRLLFNKYDARGNLLDMQKANDVREAYFWGYAGQFPVAKVVNATYDAAKVYINQSVLDAPADDAALRAEVNKMRVMAAAQVTTYTYKPLVGITSIVPPKQTATFYEYDLFGRLKAVKDPNLNTVKTYNYHYQGQSPY